MNLKLAPSLVTANSAIAITGSKSETNRLLLLQALYPNMTLENASVSDDSEVMQKALAIINHQPATINQINVHHAGTAMRFLTAYFATLENSEVVLTGSARMKERPIKILAEALKQLGADISYAENEGFPPLRIKGKKLTQNKVSLAANVSSQYISALLLIAPKLEKGLELTLEGEITSVPYINMTLSLLNEIGVDTSFTGNKITVKPLVTLSAVERRNAKFVIESDWSSASYYYAIIALSDIGTELTLSSYKQNSLQGDSILAEIYREFGVETTFGDNTIILKKAIQPATGNQQPTTINLNNAPDIAQTIAVTCFGLGISCHLTGLHTLKIKETDRLEALRAELTKLGATVSITHDSLKLEPSSGIRENISIKTYNDHRMAMAFAPLALKVPIIIEEAEVVSKSYPAFWEDLQNIGFPLSKI